MPAISRRKRKGLQACCVPGRLLGAGARACSLTVPHPQLQIALTTAASLLLQLCLQVSGLVQDLNVHLGTLIGKTWNPVDGRVGPVGLKNL